MRTGITSITRRRGADRTAGGARRRAAAVAVSAAVLLAGLTSAAPAKAVDPAPPEFYGVAASTALTAADYQKLALANIRTVRIVFHWPAIAKGPRDYNWLNVDGSVIHAAAAGVTLIPELSGSPGFVSDDPNRPPLDSVEERALWQDFVRSAVERYGPEGEFWDFVRQCPPRPGHCRPDLPYRPIQIWQVWNEPNLGPTWLPNPSPAEYADLLSLTSDAVHGVDPGAEVITGGIVPGGRGAAGSIPQNDFLAALYQRGAAEDFEGLDLHPYQRKPKQARARVREGRAMMQAYGDGATPIWITEIGWSVKGPKGDDQVTNRKGQAKRLAQMMEILTAERVRLNIRLASWFTYLDGVPLCEWCHGAGLFDAEGNAKPAWKKYVDVTGGQR